ncbi:hypothetical protein LINGRAHAP2_LOCUS38263, partial [Linum grandiflorum]
MPLGSTSREGWPRSGDVRRRRKVAGDGGKSPEKGWMSLLMPFCHGFHLGASSLAPWGVEMHTGVPAGSDVGSKTSEMLKNYDANGFGDAFGCSFVLSGAYM